MKKYLFAITAAVVLSCTGCFAPVVEEGTIQVTTPLNVYSDQVAVEISHTGVAFSLKNQTDSEQEILLIAEMFDDNDKSVGMARRRIPIFPAQTDTDINLSLTPVFHPRLWSPKSPYVHMLRLEVWKAGKHLMAREEVPYGFRALQFENENVQFNKVRMPITFEVVESILDKTAQSKNLDTAFHVFLFKDTSRLNKQTLDLYDQWGITCAIPAQTDSMLWGHPCVIALHTQTFDDIDTYSKKADLSHKRFILLLDESHTLYSLHDATKKVDAVFILAPKSQSKYAEKNDWIRPVYYSQNPTETQLP